MASVAPQPHPPAGIHSAMTASPTSCPQPPLGSVGGPRSLSALAIPPPPPTRTPPSIPPNNDYSGPSPSSSTTTSSASSSTPRAASTNPPLKPVYRSMLDIGPIATSNKHKDSKDSYSSGSVSPSRSEASSAEISRKYSLENNAHQMEFGGFSLSPVQTSSTSAIDPEDVGSDAPPHGRNQANGLARATTSPSLLTMASLAHPQRPPPAPLLRNANSYIASAKRLPDLPPPSPATLSASKVTDKQQPPQKEGFFKRVESFINKKNRNTYMTSNGDRQSDTASLSSQTQKSKGTTCSASSQSPMGSPSGSPPSSRSRESTVVDYELTPDQKGPDTTNFGHGYSASANSPARMAEQPRAGTPRMGITWGPNYVEDEDSSMSPYPMRQRRRSISQDNVSFGLKKKSEDSDAPVAMMATFSFRSAEGVGMKSRRLSTALPDEFHVDCCELSSEFSAAGSNPFVRGKTVGKGATAVVKLMYKKGESSKALYAAKEFRRKDKAEDETEYVKKVKSEFTIANSAHHPNIVRTVRLCTNHSKWNHVMEYCSYGELYHWIEKGVFRQGIWKVSDRQCLFKQLVRGVDYLHSHGIAHRDIKLENLLLNQDGHLKITDFGVSDVFSGEHPGLRTSGGQCGKNMGTVRRSAPGICGSLPYIAPEVLEKNGDYDPRPYDVWSCAIVYMVMLHGGNPWSEARPVDRFYKQFIDAWNEFFETHPDGEIKDEADGTPKVKGAFHPKFFPTASMRRLILKMLHPDPEKRPTIHDVLYSREVKSIEICTPKACDEHGNEIYEELTDCTTKGFKKAAVRKKHGHIPPKEHKTPTFFQHRFDMGDGYR